ncbi:MAG: response regulator [Hyphomicrobiaceae bacterium]
MSGQAVRSLDREPERQDGGAFGGLALLTPVVVVLAFSTAALALLSSASTQPVVLTLMAVLAAFGTFFLLGLVAGHVQLSERTSEAAARRELIEHTAEGLILVGPSGSMLTANRSARRLLGVNAFGEVRSLEEVLAGNPRGLEALFRLTRAVERGETAAEDVRLSEGAGNGGAPVWLRITAKPIESASVAEAAGGTALWSLADISADRARDRRRLAGIEARLATFEAMPVGVFSVDPGGSVVSLNGRLAGWLGYGEAASPELALRDLVAGDGAALLAHAGHDGGEASAPIGLDLLTEDGRLWPATLLVERRLAPGESGAFTAVVLAGRDALAPEPAGAEPEAPLTHHMQSAPFGIATIGADGCIVSANGAFNRLMIETASTAAQGALDVLARTAGGETREAIATALGEALAGKANIAPVEIDIALEAGDMVTRRLFLAPLTGARGRRRGAIAYLIDVTEQKALEVKFAQAQKMEAVGKLAGGIAHDFNNVLTAIIGFSDLLLGTHRPSDPAYRNIRNIRTSADRAAELVGQLLAFSRRQTLRPEVIRLSDVVSDNAAMLNRLLGEKIELKITNGRDLWHVKADKSQIGQVVINLAVNARDAMPSGGQLVIRTRNVTERESQRLKGEGMTVGEYVLIEAEDTGTGMPPEVLAKIFEPFFTTKGVGKGTGLGLSTVYGIVKQTGGFIYADSTPGKGTTFRVYIPRHEPTAEETAEQATAARKERQRDLTGTGRVLVVEDEDAVRTFAIEALKRQGYEVLSAGDGEEALEIMAACDHRVDLVVSDVIMPEMDGPTLMKELRKVNPDLKFIFVSGYPDDAFKHALDPKADFTFLPKPYSLAQIAAKVKEQMGR